MDTGNNKSAYLQLNFDQVLWLFQQLPKAFKKKLIRQWEAEEEIIGVDWSVLQEPINLDDYAISPKSIAPLKELFSDEPDAEELVQLLTT